VFHHTATGNDYAPTDVPKILRAIYYFHTVSRGWGDIGYNVLVDRFGRLWEGRSGGLTRPVVGAQAGGFNTGTAGIAVLGDFRSVAVPPPAIESTARYAAWKFSLGSAVDPRGSVSMTGGGPLSRYPASTTLTVPRIFPHRQTSATECPGAKGMDALPAIRDRAAAILGDLIQPGTVRTRLALWHPADATVKVYGGAATPVFTGTPGDVPVPADYDGDGITDLAAFSPTTASWKITTSSDGATQTLQWGSPGDRPVPADFDGDGKAEVAVWRPGTGVWYERGVGEFVWGQAGDVPVPADYTGDELADAAVFRPSTGTWYVHGGAQYRLGEAWHIPVPGDYDGDGVTEPAAWSPVSFRFFVWGQQPVRFGAAGDVPVPAQYDGDGKADFAVFHAISNGRGTWQIRGIGSYDTGASGDVPMPLR
jgi:N-acetylmuramoyl-L-alanine amidase